MKTKACLSALGRRVNWRLKNVFPWFQVDQSSLGLPSRDYYLNKTANAKVQCYCKLDLYYSGVYQKDLELFATLMWICLKNGSKFKKIEKKILSLRLWKLFQPRRGLVLKLKFMSSLFPHLLPPSPPDSAFNSPSAVSDGIPQLPGGVGGPPRRQRGNVADANGGDCGFWDHFG